MIKPSMSASVRFFVCALVLIEATFTWSCTKAKPGDACTPDKGACADPKSVLTCIQGKLALEPCKGAKGCATKGNTWTCDNTLAAVGDICDEPGDYACATDLKAALTCKGSAWVVEETCKGTRGCALKDNGLVCDNDISDPSDPCHTVGDFACAGDKKLALKCGSDHTMAPLNSCKGTRGCRVFELPEEKKIEFVCDDAVADANDPCDENGEEACTMDRKGLLKCAFNKFVSAETCSGGCSFDANGEKFVCAQRNDVVTAAHANTKPAAPKGLPGAPVKPVKKGK